MMGRPWVQPSISEQLSPCKHLCTPDFLLYEENYSKYVFKQLLVMYFVLGSLTQP